MVDLSSCERSFVLKISERPKASVLARCQSAFTPRVTNLLHERVSLDEFQCQVLRACDGTRDRAQLVQSLCDNAASGNLVIVDGGTKLSDEAAIRSMVTNLVPQILHSLA
jgi:methyltransferase-like protein